MTIEYREKGNMIQAMLGDRQVGTIVRQGDKFGYTVFGTPHMGAEDSEEKAKAAVERFAS